MHYGFDVSENNGSVRGLAVGVLPDRRFSVRARIYVLATGGIENARLLLLSSKEGSKGLGNEHDLVGRFFMVHLEYPGGVIVNADPSMDFQFNTGEEGASRDRLGVLESSYRTFAFLMIRGANSNCRTCAFYLKDRPVAELINAAMSCGIFNR